MCRSMCKRNERGLSWSPCLGYCPTATCYSSFFFFSSRRRHTRLQGDWSSDVCSSDLEIQPAPIRAQAIPSGDGETGDRQRAEGHEPRGIAEERERQLREPRGTGGDDHKIGRASCRERGKKDVD